MKLVTRRRCRVTKLLKAFIYDLWNTLTLSLQKRFSLEADSRKPYMTILCCHHSADLAMKTFLIFWIFILFSEIKEKPRLIKNESECKEENIFRAVIFREPRSRIISQFFYIMANLDAKKSHLVNNVFYNAANEKISCSNWLFKTLSAQQYYSINYLFTNYNQSEEGDSG